MIFTPKRLVDLYPFDKIFQLRSKVSINAKVLVTTDLLKWYYYDFDDKEWKLVYEGIKDSRLDRLPEEDVEKILENGNNLNDFQNLYEEDWSKLWKDAPNGEPTFIAFAYNNKEEEILIKFPLKGNWRNSFKEPFEAEVVIKYYGNYNGDNFDDYKITFPIPLVGTNFSIEIPKETSESQPEYNFVLPDLSKFKISEGFIYDIGFIDKNIYLSNIRDNIIIRTEFDNIFKYSDSFIKNIKYLRKDDIIVNSKDRTIIRTEFDDYYLLKTEFVNNITFMNKSIDIVDSKDKVVIRTEFDDYYLLKTDYINNITFMNKSIDIVDSKDKVVIRTEFNDFYILKDAFENNISFRIKNLITKNSFKDKIIIETEFNNFYTSKDSFENNIKYMSKQISNLKSSPDRIIIRTEFDNYYIKKNIFGQAQYYQDKVIE